MRFEFVFFLTIIITAQSVSMRGSDESMMSARDLRRAFNAALAKVIHSGEFIAIKNATGMNDVIACITCSPDPTNSVFPPKDSLSGRMVNILATKTLIVAGLRYIDMPSGNYVVSPPIGFWPDYLRAIVREMSAFYGVALEIKWKLFSSSAAIMDCVRDGEADMTDLYMILSSFYSGLDRIESFSVTCSPGGYESTITVLQSSGVQNMNELNRKLETASVVTIGSLSAADFASVQPFLNKRAINTVFESVADMKNKLEAGELAAGVTSSNGGDTEVFKTFRSGVVSPRAPMMLKDVAEAATTPTDNTTLVVMLSVGGAILLVIGVVLGVVVSHCKKDKVEIKRST